MASGLLAVKYEYGKRADLDQISMADWLREKKQTPRAIERFWRQVLVSAINEELDKHGGGAWIAGDGAWVSGESTNYEMGVPRVPLGELYTAGCLEALRGGEVRIQVASGAIWIIENGRREWADESGRVCVGGAV